MTSTTHERTGRGRSSRPRPRRPAADLSARDAGAAGTRRAIAPGEPRAAAAVKAAPNAAAVWYVAPGGAASAPCGTTKATACALINTAIGEAAAGDTIRVAAGTYTAATASDLVVVTKDLT